MGFFEFLLGKWFLEISFFFLFIGVGDLKKEGGEDDKDREYFSWR